MAMTSSWPLGHEGMASEDVGVDFLRIVHLNTAYKRTGQSGGLLQVS